MDTLLHSCPLCIPVDDNSDPVIDVQEGGNPIPTTEEDVKILQLASKLFPCIADRIADIKNRQYQIELHSFVLSASREYYPHPGLLLRLCYLTTVQKGNGRAPFTEKEGAIFRRAHQIEQQTGRWLGVRAIAAYAVLAFSGSGFNYLGFVSVASGNNSTSQDRADQENKIFQISLIFFAAGLVGWLTNLAGLWWTGRNPDASSAEANKQQNRIRLLQSEYSEMGLELANLYAEKKYRSLAESIAEKIDIEHIENLLNKATHDEYTSRLIRLQDFSSILTFIKSGGTLIPRNPFLRRLLGKSP